MQEQKWGFFWPDATMEKIDISQNEGSPFARCLDAVWKKIKTDAGMLYFSGQPYGSTSGALFKLRTLQKP